MRKTWFLSVVPFALAACGYASEYEEAVYEYNPVYCYQSLGAVRCFASPNHRDERRLVNYYGPHPSRYDRPEPPPVPELSAPPAIDFYVRDQEPVPEAAPRREKRRLPWLESKNRPTLEPDGPIFQAANLTLDPWAVPELGSRMPDRVPAYLPPPVAAKAAPAPEAVPVIRVFTEPLD